VKTNPVIRILGAVAVVAATALTCHLAGADLTATALALVVAVLLTALLGAPEAAAGAIASGIALSYQASPSGRLAIEGEDQVVAILAFTATAAVVGVTTARLRSLRHLSARSEQEARVRLDVANRLLNGEASEVVAASTAARVTELFDLAQCRVTLAENTVVSGQAPSGAQPITAASGDVRVDLTPRAGSDDPGSRAVLEALATGLATAFDRTRLEAEAEAARVAAAVGEGQAAFLSAMTHDLRTPLASIRAATTTLLDPAADLAASEREELLATAGSEADRLERLVTKVLELTRIRAGALTPDLQPWAVDELAQVTVRRLRPLLDGHTIVLRSTDDDGTALVDAGMIQHVLMNLLENALRHSPPGDPVVVDVGRRDGQVVVRVVDHGPGVATDDQERVFGAFVRGTPANGSGVGLGLAIVRAFVGANDGEVWYEPTPGGGATFAFAVPAVETT